MAEADIRHSAGANLGVSMYGRFKVSQLYHWPSRLLGLFLDLPLIEKSSTARTQAQVDPVKLVTVKVCPPCISIQCQLNFSIR